MVAHNNGFTILPDMMYRPWSLEGKRVETLTLQQPIPPLEIGLAWRSTSQNNNEEDIIKMKFHEYFRSLYLTPLTTKVI